MKKEAYCPSGREAEHAAHPSGNLAMIACCPLDNLAMIAYFLSSRAEENVVHLLDMRAMMAYLPSDNLDMKVTIDHYPLDNLEKNTCRSPVPVVVAA